MSSALSLLNRFRAASAKLFILAVLLAAPAVCSGQDGEELLIEALTFNIRFANPDDGPNAWEHRREMASSLIQCLAPDVLGVQEALASQLRDLDTALPHLAREGVGRDDGVEAGEFSALFYRKDRFQRIDGGTFWLSDTPDVAGSNTWDAACVRICSWLLLEERETQRRLAVYNAHLDHQSADARLRSVKLISRIIADRGHQAIPHILMGDFNATPEDPPLRYLLVAAVAVEPGTSLEVSPLPFRNTLQGPDPAQRRTYNGWSGGAKGEQIDYILVHPSAQVLGSAIIRYSKDGRFPSDHYPVSATLAFPSP